jgi:Icc protein
MTCFIHLTDLHVSHPARGDPHLHADKLAAVRHVTGIMRGMKPAPEFVVASGDLTDHGDTASYVALKDALAPIGIPVILALGNHDKRDASREVFQPGTEATTDPLFHHGRYGDLHVLVLDSSVPGRIGGTIGRAQFEMLEQALQEYPDAAKLIVCHHPPHIYRDGVLAWESLPAGDTLRLAQILEGHDIAGILCGHVHVNRVLQWRGWSVIIPVGLRNTLNRFASRDLLIEEGTGFAVCDYRPGQLDVTFVPVSPKPRELGRIGPDTLKKFE